MSQGMQDETGQSGPSHQDNQRALHSLTASVVFTISGILRVIVQNVLDVSLKLTGQHAELDHLSTIISF